MEQTKWMVAEVGTQIDDYYCHRVFSFDDTEGDIAPANGYGATPEEAEANARLIAAAPNLLALCKESWELLQEVAQMNIQPFPLRAVALNNQLRKAIAKAQP